MTRQVLIAAGGFIGSALTFQLVGVLAGIPTWAPAPVAFFGPLILGAVIGWIIGWQAGTKWVLDRLRR